MDAQEYKHPPSTLNDLFSALDKNRVGTSQRMTAHPWAVLGQSVSRLWRLQVARVCSQALHRSWWHLQLWASEAPTHATWEAQQSAH